MEFLPQTIQSNELMTVGTADNVFTRFLMYASKNTIQRYAREIEGFERFLDFTKVQHGDLFNPAAWAVINHGHIQGYFDYLLFRKGVRTTTANQCLYVIRKFALLAGQEKIISADEMARISTIKGLKGSQAAEADKRRTVTSWDCKKREATDISQETMEALKHDHPDTLKGRRDALLFTLLLDTGLRIIDAVNLTPDNIDLTRRLITVVTEKTDTPLKLRMTEDLYQAFKRYHEAFPWEGLPSIWTGVNKGGRASGSFGKHSAQMTIERAGKALGIDNLSAHDFRHKYIDRALEGGSNLSDIAQAVGHKSITMTARYARQKEISNEGIKLS